jgi:hypothetical protein
MKWLKDSHWQGKRRRRILLILHCFKKLNRAVFQAALEKLVMRHRDVGVSV